MINASWRTRLFPGDVDHIARSLVEHCAYKIDKPFTGSKLDGDDRPLLKSAKHRTKRDDNYRVPEGQTIKSMANQDDDEDFPAMTQPLLCHSPTYSGPRETGKGLRRATNRRLKSGIKVTPAAMKHMSSC